MDIKNIKTGTRLPNGTLVLDCRIVLGRDGEGREGVVLCVAHEDDEGRILVNQGLDQKNERVYITWRINEVGDTYLGHYHHHGNLAEAVVDYLERWAICERRHQLIKEAANG